MAGKKKIKRKLTKMGFVKNKCKDCGKEYESTKTEFDNGDITISPPRCPTCQTTHLTNLRVNKTIKDLSLLGNLKVRLSAEERGAVTNAVGDAFNVLLDRYSGSTVQAIAFDLKKVKA